uniref:WW domain-containing protein n=1 Tax=Anopheles culicifacies TaxID=139723 RepID=A0A182M8E3_9DIPT
MVPAELTNSATMTLPEALLKRLAKRGIIPEGNSKQNTAGTNEIHPPKGSSNAEGDSDRDRERDSDNSSERSSDDNGTDNDDVDEDRRETEAVNEEIIAEDYDEYDQVNPDSFEYASKKKSTAAAGWTEKMKQKMTKRYGYQSVDGCQNKYNIYHLCTMYCVKRYGEVEFEIEKEYDKRVKRLLERYPLPKNWRKEYDIGCKAFYFYNKDTRVVSWLPPTHPDAKLTKSAKLLRRELMEEQKQKEAANEAAPPTVVVESYPPTAPPASKPLIGPANTAVPMVPSGTGPGVENLKPPVVNPPKRPLKQSGGREDEKRARTFSSGNEPGAGGDATLSENERERDYRDRNRERRDRRDRDRSPARGEDNRFGTRDRNRERDRDREYHHRDRRPPRGPPKSAPLDPMDPAAYSDIPRGTWSAGLETASSDAGTKKEKNERKNIKQTKPDDADGADGDEDGAHEVLKISAVKEFHQEDDDDEEMD